LIKRETVLLLKKSITLLLDWQGKL